METIQVTITKKHTEGTTYDAWKNCALVRAIKQQHPDIELYAAREEYVETWDNRQYNFDHSDATGYSRKTFSMLKAGEIKEIKLTLKLASLVEEDGGLYGAVSSSSLF